MLLLDTSVLVGAFAGERLLMPDLESHMARGRTVISVLVLFEWRRGPRVPKELAWQESLLPAQAALPFGTREALLAAEIYQGLGRARGRGREVDIAIAACAISNDAQLWTLNLRDFGDIPRLRLYRPA